MSFAFRVVSLIGTATTVATTTFGQIDPEYRNLVQLGYDQPLVSQGPQAIYAYYYFNTPYLFSDKYAFRLAIAPAYLDGELGLKQLLSPTTDVGIGFNGGLFGDNYYEVRQGRYLKGESFDGDGGGVSLSIYQLLDPGMLIPLNVIVRGGVRYSTFNETHDTFHNFTLPPDFTTAYTRAGLRFAGKEPMLYPDLGLEVSFWYERQWRFNNGSYGFNQDRFVEPGTDLFWAYAGLNYAWTNTGHQLSIAVTVGGADGADRFSAWRLGGVLPLVSEFPLVLPGYYYQELTAKRFLHLYGNYLFPLDQAHQFQFRVEAAAARLQYLPGFEQPDTWQFGAGAGLSFTPKSKFCRVIVRYGYGFNAYRHGKRGAQSVGILFQYDFEAHKKYRELKSKESSR